MISTPDQYAIQADASRGVNENGHAREAHSWAGFTHHGLMPDADYSETAGRVISGKVPNPAEGATHHHAECIASRTQDGARSW